MKEQKIIVTEENSVEGKLWTVRKTNGEVIGQIWAHGTVILFKNAFGHTEFPASHKLDIIQSSNHTEEQV